MLPTPRAAVPRAFTVRINRTRLAIGLLSCVAVLGSVLGFTRDAGATQLVRVAAPTKFDQLRLPELAPEVHSCGATSEGSGIEFATSAERVESLRAQGFDVEIVIADLESFYASRIQGGGDFGLYHTYVEAIDAMDDLVAAYPDLISEKFSIGQTIEGREMWVYKISDNVDVDENEPEIFFNAYIHSREVITFEILHALATKLLDEYDSDPEIAALVDSREVFILPVTNPDGVEYNAQIQPGGGGLWRKNRRDNPGSSVGVDLNRNFGFNWGYDNIGSSGSGSSETYRGEAPFSEPESENVRQFVNSRNFSFVLNYHAYSNLEIFAFEYDNVHADEYDEHLALARLRRKTSGYQAGATWEVLYEINGGACDWMYGETTEKPSVLSILTEVGTNGDGFWPSESRIEPLIAENMPGNLAMIELADDPLRALPPAIPAIEAPSMVGRNFFLTWNTPDPDPSNLPASWNLLEGTGHSIGAYDIETNVADRWELDGWSMSQSQAHSGTQSLWSGSGNDRNHVAISQRGYLVESGDMLSFWSHHNIENAWDYGYVEISTDSRSFTSIPGSITTNSDPNGRNIGNGVTGNSGGWIQANFDLSAYEGERIWIRFRYQTDGGTSLPGWYIDDVSPTHLFSTEAVIATGLTSTTELIENHAMGDFSFLVQAVDGEGQVSPWSAPVDLTVTDAAGVSDPVANLDRARLEFASRHPFSESAELRVSAPSSATLGESVALFVVDASGRQVDAGLRGRIGEPLTVRDASGFTLRSGAVFAAGSTIGVSWTAPSNGTYFLTLRVGGEEQMLRLVGLP